MTEISEMIGKMGKELNDYMLAGFALQATSIDVIATKVLERYPSARRVELCVIIDESWTERDMKVFDDREYEVDLGDWPTDNDFDEWWMVASEGAVFAEDGMTTINLPDGGAA